MDIHKPKPWHGVREFLKEYVIIVVGVLTALGAEQVVEAIHTANKAAEAEELVREELARNIAFARDRVAISPCNQANFQLVERLLLGTPADRPVPALKRLRVLGRPLSWRQWETAVASGAADHFPPERRHAYQRIYLTAVVEGGRSLNSVDWAEGQTLGRLQVLKLGPRRLEASDRERMLEDVTEAIAYEGYLARNDRTLVDYAQPLHLPPPTLLASTHLMTPADIKACLDGVAAEASTLPPLPATAQ